MNLVKSVALHTLYRTGSVHTILWGPSRGLRYKLFEAGIAPLYGGWERTEQKLMAAQLKPGSTAYDIGANHGIHTLLMAKLVGPHGRVCAFEPLPENATELRANVALNNFSHVTIFEMAVSDSLGMEYFNRGTIHSNGHLSAEGQSSNGFHVKTNSLDNLALAENAPPPTFIKIDVEGAESRVLSGAIKVLETYWPALLIELHTPDQDMAVGRILSSLGYEAHRTTDGSRVRTLTSGWPDPEGLWGRVLATPRRGFSRTATA
jgi:FkbM family methyltransferase